MWRAVPVDPDGLLSLSELPPVLNIPCGGKSVYLGRNTDCKLRDPTISRTEVELHVSASSSSSIASAASSITATVGQKNSVQFSRPTAQGQSATEGWETKGPGMTMSNLASGTLVGILGTGSVQQRKATYRLEAAEQAVIDWIKADETRWWPYVGDNKLSHLWVKADNTFEKNAEILETGGACKGGRTDGGSGSTFTAEQALHRLTPGLINIAPDCRPNGPVRKHNRRTLYDKWSSKELHAQVDRLREHLIAVVHNKLLLASRTSRSEGSSTSSSGGGATAKRKRDPSDDSGGSKSTKPAPQASSGGASASSVRMADNLHVRVDEIRGDLITCGADIIVQQCNCIGTDGRGLALTVMKRLAYGDPYSKRRKLSSKKRFAVMEDRSIPGTILVLEDPTSRGPAVANIFGQFEMGKPGKYKRVPMPAGIGAETAALREQWFKKSLKQLKEHVAARRNNLTIAFPHGIGCGLAGGSWKAYHAAILSFAQSIPQHRVIIVRL